MNSPSPLILVTGASGFVGRAVVRQLNQSRRFCVRGAGRNSSADAVSDYHVIELDKDASWSPVVSGVEAVIHCAARVHIMQDSAIDSLAEFRRINVDGTLALARQAAAAGVKRFIFISSIKVNGESTHSGEAFLEGDQALPEDPYGVSKWEAEQGLRTLAEATGMAVVIIRPPLVYGPGVKGNFLNLLKLAKSGLPLPLGSIHNQRSMIYLGNLVDLIIKCIDHPAAINQTFLASDGRDLSTTELLQLLRRAMNLPARLLPVPQSLLLLFGRLTGRAPLIDRLCGSLQVDIHKARTLLDWTPPYTVEDGIQETVSYFMNEKQDSP